MLKIVQSSAFRSLEGLRLDKFTRFIVDLPSALFFTVFEAAFVPQLPIGVVPLPGTVLLLVFVKAAGRSWFTRFVKPFPTTRDFAIFESAS